MLTKRKGEAKTGKARGGGIKTKAKEGKMIERNAAETDTEAKNMDIEAADAEGTEAVAKAEILAKPRTKAVEALTLAETRPE